MEQQPLWALLLFQFRKTYCVSASVDSLEHQNRTYKRKICRNSFENTVRKQLFHFVWRNFCLLCPICRMVIWMFVSGTSIDSHHIHKSYTQKIPERNSFWKSYYKNFYCAINMKIYIRFLCSCFFEYSFILELIEFTLLFIRFPEKWLCPNVPSICPTAWAIRTVNQCDPGMKKSLLRLGCLFRRKNIANKS